MFLRKQIELFPKTQSFSCTHERNYPRPFKNPSKKCENKLDFVKFAALVCK